MNRRAFLFSIPAVAVVAKLLPTTPVNPYLPSGYGARLYRYPMTVSVHNASLYGGSAGGGKSSVLMHKLLETVDGTPKKLWAYANDEQAKFFKEAGFTPIER